MTIPEFLRIYEEALELEPGTISGTEALTELGWWDSMAALVFMSLADEKLGVVISGADLGKCASVPDLLALFGDKIAR
jgi:acyl carrier protein